MQVFHLKDVDERRKRECAARKRHYREVKTDPDAPGKGFAEIGGLAQTRIKAVEANDATHGSDERQKVDVTRHRTQFVN